jgi:multidrug efflux pump subunit AcrA (membrane-fusion protein)
MKWRGLGIGLTITLGAAMLARTETLGQAPATSAKVDAIPLDLVAPERYLIPSVLEPVRHVTLIAPTDGIVRTQAAQLGAMVREGSEVAQMDRAEASAHLKIAQAELKERQAELEIQKATTGTALFSQAQSRLEAAQGRLDLAQLAFDRCSLRAPFSGKILDAFVSEGQFVTRGTILADLADVTSLKAIIAVGRAEAKLGAQVPMLVEGQAASAKVNAILPLPDSMATLRELACPLVATSVVLANASGEFEPGQRTRGLTLPDAPITQIPPSAIHGAEGRAKEKTKAASAADSPSVQVIRNEYVTTIKVRVLGPSGPDRLQVTGAFRPNDALIVHSSVPLIPGTLLRFTGGTADTIEATVPDPSHSGKAADLTPPSAVGTGRAAPIGAPGSAVPKNRPAPKSSLPSEPPKASGAAPF